MKSLISLITGILMLWIPTGFSAPQAQIFQSASVTRRFTATMHYVYHSREYRPAVSLVYVDRRPTANTTPEAALISQLSALHKGDYDWWIGTWDPRSRDKLRIKQEQSEQARDLWLKSARAQYGSGNCSLATWILRREYVILRYACAGNSKNSVARAGDHALAFKMQDGKFVATLDLEKDPIFKYANGTNIELEIKPRD